ncbi:acetyl-CoA carboxylase biotin carboxylase subunit [Pediococcus ethanolidurans]|uniref:acetyl-CoA carboxylase biotin carboxylase subunit n=1 Tax=Pediococcus ethanolidurans TaxID=319653 RepID=UPI001C1EF246|nr:biotin carboxylase N-terminal domain-containing protein [Pediococcus ethanolidurans]MBU7554394.1 acetyl-CoA carboxylase biotin carboxylase subunit [Pediococcus ethanolidurans]MCV3315192.1 acetyl-CoA carboxylase biotin carboxylase subunit [Pediococcus ethanolidurans]MCV3321260.1 acetyl-CoA carboxylase biotin carboxylase subunit [Pediococcus ethanolidurans]
MFKKILIANRGEIAIRIIKACQQLKIATVAVYSTADRQALFVQLADEAVCIGPASAKNSYLNREAILMAGINTNADAIHPGYGFLSEDELFAQMCEECGMTWIGPQASLIHDFSDKTNSRKIAKKLGLPIIPGTGMITSEPQLYDQANKLGYPVLLKASHGGGGKGIRMASSAKDLFVKYETVKEEAGSSFLDGSIYLERDFEAARHIEVQVLGMPEKLLILGDRDCSLQKHRQKIIEESNASILTQAERQHLYKLVHQLLDGADYQSLGTVEFLFVQHQFYFLEMNTRLQVEHGITEETSGVDIVQAQIKVAAHEPFELPNLNFQGHAIECRLNAENDMTAHLFETGKLTEFAMPTGIRVDTGLQRGDVLTPFYDRLLAKIIVHGTDRTMAVKKMQDALAQTKVNGIGTNLKQLKQIISSEQFIKDNYYIHSVGKMMEESTHESFA